MVTGRRGMCRCRIVPGGGVRAAGCGGSVGIAGGRCVRRMLLLVAVYVGSLAVVLLLVGAVYEFLLRFVG